MRAKVLISAATALLSACSESFVTAPAPIANVDSGVPIRIGPATSQVDSLHSVPLLIVDGVVVQAGINRLRDLNPQDIEAIEVIKGPAAAPLYGSTTNCGPIVITTRRGP
jgi:outer membrane receptor protein involved in Fe transport